MKKLVVFLLAVLVNISCYADLGTIIAIPSNAWMKTFHYGSNEQMPNGRTRFNPDFNLAFEDTRYSLTAVLRELSEPFNEFFKVEDLSMAMANQGEDDMLYEEYGADISMSEQIIAVVKPDVKLEVSYVEDEGARMGPRHRYNLEVSALDAWTNDILATFNGVTDLSSEPVNKQVGRLMASNMQELLGKIRTRLDETAKYGREVKVTCLTKNMSFNTDQANGQVLKYAVRDILKDVAIEGRSTNKKDTDHLQDYRVRFALTIKMEDMGEILQKRFSSIGIPARVDKKGLGKFVIIFGE